MHIVVCVLAGVCFYVCVVTYVFWFALLLGCLERVWECVVVVVVAVVVVIHNSHRVTSRVTLRKIQAQF